MPPERALGGRCACLGGPGGLSGLTFTLGAGEAGTGVTGKGDSGGSDLPGREAEGVNLSFGRGREMVGFKTTLGVEGVCAAKDSSQGATSFAGVEGMVILIVGSDSSFGRTRMSANFRMYHRTSWSTSGALET